MQRHHAFAQERTFEFVAGFCVRRGRVSRRLRSIGSRSGIRPESEYEKTDKNPTRALSEGLPPA
jgi:hypothetical protein